MYAKLVCMIVALSLIIASSTVETWLTVLVNDSVQVIDTMLKKNQVSLWCQRNGFQKNMSYNAICYYVLKEYNKYFYVSEIKK